MSSEHTPYTGRPSTEPSTRAVTTPTRNPVYGPGPTPTATPVRSPRAAPASAMTFAIMGVSSSECRLASSANASLTTRSPSCRATLTASVAVSKPTTSTPPSLVAAATSIARLEQPGRGRLGEGQGRGRQLGPGDRPVVAAVGMLQSVDGHGHDDVVVAHDDGRHVRDGSAYPEHLQGTERLVAEPAQQRHRGPRVRRVPRRVLRVLQQRGVGVDRGLGGAAVPAGQ